MTQLSRRYEDQRDPRRSMGSPARPPAAGTPQPVTGVGPSWSWLPQALGWFSVGLGLTELLLPRRTAHAIGAPLRPQVMRALGVRELVSGVGILTGRNTGAWLHSRVAGDLMDLALLGASYRARRAERAKLIAATAAVAGVAALDLICSAQLAAPRKPMGFTKTVAINRPADELYLFWRSLDNLPRIFSHLESVTKVDDGRSHWKAKPALGHTLEWDALIATEKQGKQIAWRSVEHAALATQGSVEFQPLATGRGTAVKVTLQFTPPGGAVGAAFASLWKALPEIELDRDLRRYKQSVETGEVASTEGQPSGRRSLLSRNLP
jgi:uncharacterized membrane protein